jgi:integron integrase
MPPIDLPSGPPRLLDQVRDRIRFKHYSWRTEQAYIDWIKRYIRFSDNCHPSALSAIDVERFLAHLAAEEGVAQSTQNQAPSALLFLYRQVLGRDVRWLAQVPRVRAPATLPVVLTPAEVTRLLKEIAGTHRLFGALLCGTGMRILEAARLRVKDIDLARREIVVRNGKGAKDRVTVLPDRLVPALRRHLVATRALHQVDVERGHGSVWLPFALERKYPGASREWAWQYVFPADRLSIDSENVRCAVITLASSHFSAPCAKRSDEAASPSWRRHIRCAIRLPRTCSNRVPTSGRSRNCSVTPTSERR